MYSIMKLYENEEEVFIKGYAYDICKIVAAVHRKQIGKGKENYEMRQRLKNIEKKDKILDRELK